MNIKKVIHWGSLGKCSNIPNFLFEMEFEVYTNIQAISILVCPIFDDNGFVMCNYLIFNNSCFVNPSREKSCFLVTSKPTPPTVFNLKASNYIHCEEETGTRTGISQDTYKLFFFYKFLKLFILPQKNTLISKNSVKFYHSFFFRKIYSSIRIYVLNALTI